MPDYPLSKAPTVLADERRARGLTQEQLGDQLADLVGWSPNTARSMIGRWEKEIRGMTVHTLVQWADALGYEVVLRRKP